MLCGDTMIRLSKAVSYALSAPVYATALGWYLLWKASELTPLNVLAVLAFLGIGPTISVAAGVGLGVTDVFVSNRRKRFWFFMGAVASYSVGSVAFTLTHNGLLASFTLAYLIVTAVMALATLRVKASVHMAGIVGPTTFMVLTLGVVYATLYSLAAPVALARYCLRAHSRVELILGCVVAVCATTASWFWSSAIGLTALK